MPTAPNTPKTLTAIMNSDLPAHYKLVALDILSRLHRQRGAAHEGLAWPSIDNIAYRTDLSAAKVKATLQHLAHARILRAHGRTRGGHERWELRVEALASTDPLMQVMLNSVLRDLPGLPATARHVLSELALIADTDLQLTASFSEIRRSLPWLTAGAYRWSIRRLSAAGIIQEIARGNRYRGTRWRITPPRREGYTQLESRAYTQLEPGGHTQLESHTQLGPGGYTQLESESSPVSHTQLEPGSGADHTQLEPSSQAVYTQLERGAPYIEPVEEEPVDHEPAAALLLEPHQNQQGIIKDLRERLPTTVISALNTAVRIREWDPSWAATVAAVWAEVSAKPDISHPAGVLIQRLRSIREIEDVAAPAPDSPMPEPGRRDDYY